MKKQPFPLTLFLLICLSKSVNATAQTVEISDPNLRAAIETALSKPSGNPITAAEMETLTFLDAGARQIRALTGLESATNLTFLFLLDNSISDLTPLAGLTNLRFLGLQYNSVSDLSPVVGLTNLTFLGLQNNSVSALSPLVGNTGLGAKDTVNVMGNPLSYPSLHTHIPALQARGVEVFFDSRTPTPLLKISGEDQEGVTGVVLMQPFVIEVWDENGLAFEGVPVMFTATEGGGTLHPEITMTDADGRAESWLTLGSDPGTNTVEVSVEGIAQTVVFSAEASLPPPMPTALSVISGDNQNGLTGEVLANPFVVEVRDQYDDPMEGVTVTFVISVGGGMLSDTTAITDANGLAQSTLTLGSDPGGYTVEVSVEGISQMAVFSAEASLPPPVPTVLSTVSGDNQSGLTGEVLANPFVVEVRDQYDDPMEGVTVTFVISADGGMLSDTTAITDANGLAQSTLTLGSDPGGYTVEVSVEGISQMAVFSAEASLPPPVPTVLSTVSGDNQTGLTGEVLANPFVVEVRDQYDAPMEGVTVTFVVSVGGGMLSDTTAITDANGLAQSTLTLGSDPGTNTVEVSVEGISQMAVFSAEASLPPPVPTVLSTVSGDNQSGLTGEVLANPFVVEVRDQYDDPMEGVTVTFVISADGGMLSDTTAITDANGLAQSTLTLGSDPGTNTVEVSVEGISQMAVFSAEASLPPPVPTVLSTVSGDNQNGLTGEVLANPFVVEVRDQYDDPVEGVTVTFVVSAGGGMLSDTTAITDANGLAQSTLTLGNDPGTNTVEVGVEGIAEMVTFNALAELLEFDLSLPAGISLIHIPLRVRAVDGEAQTIESVADLYDALGGAETVNFLVTYAPATQAWFAYFGASDTGTSADRELTEEMGILVGMIAPAAVRFGGDALGTDGSSTITLNRSISFVGLPLKDPSITRVSDLFALDGIRDNAPVIIVLDNEEFKVVGRAGDPGDIEITGGQAFILIVQQETTVAISGDGWDNTAAGTMAAPLMMKGIQTIGITPVLALSGSIVDGVNGINSAGLHVIVKNLSTGSAATTVIGDAGSTSSQGSYRLTFVDIKSGRAAQIGDTLEISVKSPDTSIGVQPLRYTVTAEDVRRSRIELPALVLQEMPAETQLLRNYPNPFNPETWIPYQLDAAAEVKLTIYDVKGELVRRLDLGYQQPGYYINRAKAAYWDGRNDFGQRVVTGVYFYQLQASDYSATRRMVILK